MSERNIPTLDAVEDRVRRTCAARAEDMAPGDAAGALPDLGRDVGATHRRLSGGRRPLLAAAAVVVVAAATIGVALAIREGDGRGGRVTTAAEQPPSDPAVATVTAPRAVVEALQDERRLAVTVLTGLEGAIALPVNDTAQARRDTDAAIAGLASFVATAPDGAAYRSGLDGLGALDDLRRDIDAVPGPGSLADVGTAQEASDRYAAIVGGLLDDQLAYAETIDDPVVQAGAVAYGRGLRLREQTTQLAQVSLLTVVRPGPESVAEVARLHGEVQYGLDTLVTEATGTPFADAALAAAGSVEGTGLLDAAERAMDGTGDVTVILGAVDLLEGEAWPAFLDSVEESLTAAS